MAETDHTRSELKIHTPAHRQGAWSKDGEEAEMEPHGAFSPGKGTVEGNATEVSSVTQRYIKTSLPQTRAPSSAGSQRERSSECQEDNLLGDKCINSVSRGCQHSVSDRGSAGDMGPPGPPVIPQHSSAPHPQLHPPLELLLRKPTAPAPFPVWGTCRRWRRHSCPEGLCKGN